MVQGHLQAARDIQAGRRIVARGIRAGGAVTSGADIRSGTGIDAGSHVVSHGHLEADWGIRTGGCMTASGAIRAGESLQAKGAIQAGDGYGIFAGLHVAVDYWEANATVRAVEKPARLLSGWWAGAAAF